MKRDHFVVRPASPVRPLRCRTGFACKTILVLALYSLFFIPAFAQSNLMYELKVGTTGEVQVLTNFPESYQGEKVNVRVQTASLTDRYADRIQTASLKDFDFIFAGEEPIEGFSEVYRFTEGEQEWVVWRNGKEIKNRAQRTLVGNAYNAFETYLHETLDVKKNRGWIWWVFAGWLLAGTGCYRGCV